MHESLYNMYKVNFALVQHHNYSFSDLEEMFPFEREIYVSMLMQHLDDEKNRQPK